ncbi:MAG: hypothetical protein AAF542_10950 [Pseudomonadota bacterium]
MDKGDRKYLAITYFTLLISIILAASWNYLGDPYGMWRISPEKPLDLFWHTRLHKPYRMQEVRASHLILGSSRSGRIPADSSDVNSVIYNAAHPGTTLYEIRRQLEHGQAIRSIESVIIGLDFYMFRRDKEKLLFKDLDDRLARIDSGTRLLVHHYKQILFDYWRILFSRSAVLASYYAHNNSQTSSRRFYPAGHWESIPGPVDSKTLFERLANQKRREFKELGRELDFNQFTKILEFCLNEGIRTDILVSPIHAKQMKVINDADRWSDYLGYHRELVRISSKYKNHGLNVRVVGFEHNRDLVHDSIENPKWFRDGIHYNLLTGRKIVNCLWGAGTQCESPIEPWDISRANLEGYLREIDRNRRRFVPD